MDCIYKWLSCVIYHVDVCAVERGGGSHGECYVKTRADQIQLNIITYSSSAERNPFDDYGSLLHLFSLFHPLHRSLSLSLYETAYQ